jgi:uncharacterized protein (TIGR02145 family)
MACCCATLHAQQSAVWTFTATYQAAPVVLDSIRISNLTQGLDTVLYAPDTVLVLDGSTGLNAALATDPAQLQVLPGGANPFGERTALLVALANGGEVRLGVTDVLGRTMADERLVLPAGVHRFELLPGPGGTHLVTVEQNGERAVWRVVHDGSGSRARAAIRHMGLEEGGVRPRNARSTFIWMQGDQLRYIGHATLPNGYGGSDLIVDAPGPVELVTFQLRNGLPCPTAPEVVDVQGNSYRTVQIGTQCWMAENLRATQYDDGTPITHITGITAWQNASTEAYCWPGNDPVLGATYGALYNWYVTDPASNGGRSVCPAGWHVPTDQEWIDLRLYMVANGHNYDGSPVVNKIGKAMAADTLWAASTVIGAVGNDLSLNNSSGFTTLPAGTRNPNGIFAGQLQFGNFWSATEAGTGYAWYQAVRHSQINLFRDDGSKIHGFSLRCIQDD